MKNTPPPPPYPHAADPVTLAALRSSRKNYAAIWDGQVSLDPAWITDGRIAARASAAGNEKLAARLLAIKAKRAGVSGATVREIFNVSPPSPEQFARMTALEARDGVRWVEFRFELTGETVQVTANQLGLLDRILGGWDVASGASDSHALYLWRDRVVVGALMTRGRMEAVERVGEPPCPRAPRPVEPPLAVDFPPPPAAPVGPDVNAYLVECVERVARAMGGLRDEWQWVLPTRAGRVTLHVSAEGPGVWSLVLTLDDNDRAYEVLGSRAGAHTWEVIGPAMLPALLTQHILPLALAPGERRAPHLMNLAVARPHDRYVVVWRGGWCIVDKRGRSEEGRGLRALMDDSADPSRGRAPRDVLLGRAARLNTASFLRRVAP